MSDDQRKQPTETGHQKAAHVPLPDIEGFPCLPCSKCGALLVVSFDMMPVKEVQCAGSCRKKKEAPKTV